MTDFLTQHKEFFFWLTGLSVFFFVFSLLAIPYMLIRIPPDYFIREQNAPEKRSVLKLFLLIIKNCAGFILLICGIAMLVLPGQGILTILIAVVIMDFPGKRKLERRLISYPYVLKTVNRMRKHANHKPLKIDNSK